MKLTLSAHEQRIHDLLLTDLSGEEIGRLVDKPAHLVFRVANRIYVKRQCKNGRASLMAAEIKRLGGCCCGQAAVSKAASV